MQAQEVQIVKCHMLYNGVTTTRKQGSEKLRNLKMKWGKGTQIQEV